ncbi:MAG: hypothetical protein A3F67_00520 [Verrucomicrobia bacterium RIFCSPHIGHO2_12_FULL_41_10]|nr:MAG: hypothetical protein A3F67_00520 [Verrucomicrobia bacterium RIFCSPHIGHO2_12_FULL_41_10]HLB32747.1 OmpH family outer membrane protein [Chthoniobacterales bacterium]
MYLHYTFAAQSFGSDSSSAGRDLNAYTNLKINRGLMLKSLFLLFSVLFLMSNSHAETKIGIMDMNRIFTEYYKTKDAQSHYVAVEASANKELNERIDSLKKEMEEINKLNAELEKPELSKEEHDAKAKIYKEKVAKARILDREIVEFRSAKQKKLQEQSLGMRKDIIDEIMKVVNEQIKIRGFNIVFDKSGLSAGAVPVVLYSSPDFDVSSEVIAVLNSAKKELTTKSTKDDATSTKKD